MSILLVFKRVRCRCAAPGAVQAADDTPAAAVAALFVTIMKHFNTAAAEKPPKIVELQTNLLLCSCIFNSQIRPLLVLEPSRYIFDALSTRRWPSRYFRHLQQGDGPSTSIGRICDYTTSDFAKICLKL